MKSDGSGIGGRGLLIASAVFILIVGAIFFAISGGLFGGDRAEEGDARITATDVYSGRSVRMTVEGPIVANEERESYQIEIGVDSRSIEVRKGYDVSVVGSGTYSNNNQAYTDFVFALARQDFDDVRDVSEEQADERGVCATGKQYIFEVLDDGRVLSRSWTTSCPEDKGTFQGDVKAIKQLFDSQIPDRTTILKPIRLR